MSLISNSLECGICYDDYKDPELITSCGHTYCKICLSGWLKKNNNCPECRGAVNKTIPNFALKKVIELAAQKVEEVAKPPIEVANSPKLEKTMKSTAQVTQVEEVSKEPEGLLLAVHVTVLNFESGQMDKFRMPQCEDFVAAIIASIASGKPPRQQLEVKEAAAKIDCLVLNPHLDVSEFLRSNNVTPEEVHNKTIKKICGLEFQNGIVGLTTEKTTLYYRIEDHFRKAYQDAQNSKDLQDAIIDTLLVLLYHPSQLQAMKVVPKQTSRELVVEELQKALKCNLQKPDAEFSDILELDEVRDVTKKIIVGVCYERPTVKPEPKPEKGIPITLATTIDQIPEYLNLIKYYESLRNKDASAFY